MFYLSIIDLFAIFYKMTTESSAAVTHVSNNVTNDEGNRDESLAKVEVAVLATILVLALVGNSVVIMCLSYMKRNKKRLGRMHWFILHLSVADLFVAIGNVFPQLLWDITYRFQGGDFLCRLVKYFQLVAMFASSYMLVMTAVDRYVAICHPFRSQRWSINMVHKLAALAWGISFTFSLPQMFLFSYREVRANTNVHDCLSQFGPEWTLTFYITWISVSVYIIPTIILLAAYGRISATVWKSEKIAERLSAVREPVVSSVSQVCVAAEETTGQSSYHAVGESMESDSAGDNSNNQPAEHRNDVQSFRMRVSNYFKNKRLRSSGISRGKIRTIKLSVTVTLCYFLCWSPFFIAQLWAVYDSNAPFYGAAYAIILLLASLNSCTNPWIYLAFSDSVNETVRIIICCLICRPKAQKKYQQKIRQSDNMSNTQVTSIQ